MEFVASPLSPDEEVLFEHGRLLFNAGKYWHAHESWEDVWNCLKRRNATPEEILLVQGLIQTAALLYHHEHKNHVGILKQWAKLVTKLDGWEHAWGVDVKKHLQTIKSFVSEEGIVNIEPNTVQL